MKQNLKEMVKGKNGITLIALVITIIVLLILAGITIATLTGDNGILTKAKQTKEQTQQAEKEEKNDVARIEDIINEYDTGIKVEQVTDVNPGVLEQDETNVNTYIINSIEDLVFFSYDVRQGNTYEGQTVNLGLSLDFNSSKSYVDAFRTDYGKYGYDGELKTLLTTGEGFKPIGKTSTKSDNTIKEGNFAGTFDGNNFVLSNCYMNKDVTQMTENYRMALFGGYLYGEIKNLGLVNTNYNLINSSKECYVSGLAILSKENSKIYNCYVTGNIRQTSMGVGNVNCSGIVAFNSGKIENCYNATQIIGEINDSTLVAGCYIGGIVVNQQENSIVNSYNTGNLIASGTARKFEIGGIARIITGKKDNKIEKSYNTGKITLEDINNAERVALGRDCSICRS